MKHKHIHVEHRCCRGTHVLWLCVPHVRMGHADHEISAAFSRFDQDGNQTLDKQEQEKMKQELEEKRVHLIFLHGLVWQVHVSKMDLHGDINLI